MEASVCPKLSIMVCKPCDTDLCATSRYISLSFPLFQPTPTIVWRRKLILTAGIATLDSSSRWDSKIIHCLCLHYSLSLRKDSRRPQVKSWFWPNELVTIIKLMNCSGLTGDNHTYTTRLYRWLQRGRYTRSVTSSETTNTPVSDDARQLGFSFRPGLFSYNAALETPWGTFF